MVVLAIGLLGLAWISPSNAASFRPVPPSELLSFEECEVWHRETVRDWSRMRNDDFNRVYFQSSAPYAQRSADADQNSREYSELLSQVSGLLRNCRERARMRRAAQERLAALVPRGELGSPEHEAYSRLHPRLGTLAQIVNRYDQVNGLLSLPDTVSSLMKPTVDGAYDRALALNDAMPPSIWQRLNQETLGVLRRIHQSAFDRLEGALNEIKEFGSQNELQQVQRSAVAARMSVSRDFTALRNENERAVQSGGSTPETMQQVVSRAGAARAEETRRADVARRAEQEAAQRQAAQRPPSQQSSTHLPSAAPTPPRGPEGGPSGPVNCATLDATMTAALQRSGLANPSDSGCHYVLGFPRFWRNWRSAAAQCSAELVQSFDAHVAELQLTASQMCVGAR